MADRLKNMKLSAAERRKIEVEEMGMSETTNHQALGRLLSERLAHPDALERALGRLWCPLKGIECKALGENKFLITFLQASGMRKALEERPWVFSNELLVLAELDEEKSIDEIEFTHIPIWIRILKLPIGMMNKATGEAVGKEVGEFLEVEMEEGAVMVNNFLRVKVRLDIRKPLMRGVTDQVGKDGREKWCPLIYEHLPDFCYTCGVIGHTEKICDKKLTKGEIQQYDRSLRWMPPKFRGEQEQGVYGGSRSGTSGRSGSSNERLGGRSGRWGMTSNRSDGPTWRKKGVEDGEEVTSPAKEKEIGGSNEQLAVKAKRGLFEGQGSVPGKEMEVDGRKVVMSPEPAVNVAPQQIRDVNSAMQKVQEKEKVETGEGRVVLSDQVQETGKNKSKTFKRHQQTIPRSVGGGEKIIAGKRGLDDVDMAEAGVDIVVKRGRVEMEVVNEVNNTKNVAGLSGQPCEKQ